MSAIDSTTDLWHTSVTMPAKKASSKHRSKRENTNAVRCVEALGNGFSVGLPDHGSEPVTRTLVPSVQDALRCILRLKRYLGLSTPAVAAAIGLPRNTVMDWVAGRTKPEPASRMLLPYLEREYCRPQDPTDPAQDTPTGSVQPAPDVIFTSKPGDIA